MDARGRLSAESGFTLVEMLVVLAILGIVLAALTGLFLSATRTAADQNARFHAQQEGRLALDGLRREIHCANDVSATDGATAWTSSTPKSSIKITLGSYCSSAPSGGGIVTWCTIASGAGYALWRTPGTSCISSGGIRKADYLTAPGGQVFSALAPAGGGLRAKLGVRLPVDVSATTPGGVYELQDDIVLRNTPRTP